MPWWGWVIAGFALALIEFITPGGFIAIFFALAAIVVGALASAVALPDWVQWTLFAGLSVASLFGFRRRLLEKFSPHPGAQQMGDVEGGVAKALEDILPGAFGKGEFRGAQWTLRNVDSQPLKAGQRCRIEKTDGLTLLVKVD